MNTSIFRCISLALIPITLMACTGPSRVGTCQMGEAFGTLLASTLACSGKKANSADCLKYKRELDNAITKLSNQLIDGQYQTLQTFKGDIGQIKLAKTKPSSCDPNGQAVLILTKDDNQDKAIDLPSQTFDPRNPPEIMHDIITSNGERHIILRSHNGGVDQYYVLRLQQDGQKYALDKLIQTDRNASLETRRFSDEQGNSGYYTWNPKDRDPQLVGWASNNPNSISQFGRLSLLQQKANPPSGTSPKPTPTQIATNDTIPAKPSTSKPPKKPTKPTKPNSSPDIPSNPDKKPTNVSTKPNKPAVEKVIKFEEIKVVADTSEKSRGVVIDLNKKV